MLQRDQNFFFDHNNKGHKQQNKKINLDKDELLQENYYRYCLYSQIFKLT